jgi:hypothetical protein
MMMGVRNQAVVNYNEHDAKVGEERDKRVEGYKRPAGARFPGPWKGPET